MSAIEARSVKDKTVKTLIWIEFHLGKKKPNNHQKIPTKTAVLVKCLKKLTQHEANPRHHGVSYDLQDFALGTNQSLRVHGAFRSAADHDLLKQAEERAAFLTQGQRNAQLVHLRNAPGNRNLWKLKAFFFQTFISQS